MESLTTMESTLSRNKTSRRQFSAIFSHRLAIACSLLAGPLCAQGNFHEYSLEELAEMPVVESSKPGFQLFDAPNGAFVFDQEAIENLPVDSIPEMLRYAPGVHLMRANNGTWGLGIRGMNSQFLNRSLFTVDEQSLYGTIFRGLFGSDHDILLDDVASVEVVYGPGGSLWGTNAANGRVNVLLKSVFETEGSILKSRVGSQNRSLEARHGWLIDEDSGIRVWARHSDRQSSTSDFDNDWTTNRAGVRYEKRPNSENLLSFSAEFFDSELGYSRTIIDPTTGRLEDFNEPETQNGYTAQVKWTHEQDKTNGYSIRSWVGNSTFCSDYANYDLGLFGLELRSLISPSDQHQFVFVAGMTIDNENLIDTEHTTFIDDYTTKNSTAHMGAEYTFKLPNENTEASVGFSGNYDSYSDSISPLPSARLLFRLKNNSRAWIAYSSSSRAIPSGIKSIESLNSDYRIFDGITISTLLGNFDINKQLLNITWQDTQVEKERLDAVEIGYRKIYHDGGSITLTAFANHYDDIMGFRDHQITPILGVENPYMFVELTIDTIASGVSYGLELSREWILSKQQHFVFNYSYITDSFEAHDRFLSSLDSLPILASEIYALENNVPSHLASIWYSYSMDAWRLDIGLRYNSAFENSRSEQHSSVQADVRLTWSASKHTRISLVGRNLLESETDESALKAYVGTGSEIIPEGYLEVSLKF